MQRQFTDLSSPSPPTPPGPAPPHPAQAAREEAEREAMLSVDWHDFVVVETIEFYDDELDELPAPMTVKDVRAGLRWRARPLRCRGCCWAALVALLPLMPPPPPPAAVAAAAA